MIRSIFASVLVASALSLTATVIHAATPEQACQKGRYSALAKYNACEQKALGKAYAIGYYNSALERCHTKYTATWAKLQAKAAGTGSTCDNPRYADNGDGTVLDRLTALQWEQKTAPGSGLHDVSNTFTWSAGGAFTAADGTLFTGLLATLNTGACFAGHCDWRAPTIYELQTLLQLPCQYLECIDAPVFGWVQADSYYWSATTDEGFPDRAWFVKFGPGWVGHNFGYFGDPKSSANSVRVVRGGL